jgi:peptidoglycan hydrolase-like protein with peptidoglycan-binding domain
VRNDPAEMRRISGVVAALTATVAVMASMPASSRAGVIALGPGDRGAEVATWQATIDHRWQGVIAGAETAPRAVRAFIRTNGLLAKDGAFGPLTERATRIFQRELGLRATGVVDFATWKATTRGMLTCCGAGYPLLGEGTWSPEVIWWQVGLGRWLAKHAPGVPELIPDGVFGPLTERATAIFQRSTGIAADGIAGPITWKRMDGTGLLHMP